MCFPTPAAPPAPKPVPKAVVATPEETKKKELKSAAQKSNLLP